MLFRTFSLLDQDYPCNLSHGDKAHRSMTNLRASAGTIRSCACLYGYTAVRGAIPQCQRRSPSEQQKRQASWIMPRRTQAVAGSGEPLFAPLRAALNPGPPFRPA